MFTLPDWFSKHPEVVQDVGKLLTAATISGAGLATDNATLILGSMLVSPFGARIKGVSEAIAGHEGKTLNFVLPELGQIVLYIALCVIVGLISSAAMDPKKTVFNKSKSDDGFDFGHELEVRGNYSGGGQFLIAFMIGLLGGILIHSGHASDSVGVGLATSLLPPCVAAGMYMQMTTFTDDEISTLDNGPGHASSPTKKELWERAGVAFGTVAINIASMVAGATVARLLQPKVATLTMERVAAPSAPSAHS